MALIPRLELRQQQRLSLTPVLRTRLSVLRMSPAELEDELAREAARNPFLLHERGRGPAATGIAPDEGLASPDTGFHEALRGQVVAMALDPADEALVIFLIGELREDGYLDTDLPTLAQDLGLDLPRLETALHHLQSCEPVGIAARSLSECLMLQLVERGHARARAEAIVAQLATLARRDWPAAARALDCDEAAVRRIADELRHLSPRPIPEPRDPANELLRPDLRFEKVADGTFAIRPDRAGRPSVSLDAALVRRAEAQGFAEELLDRARVLVDAVNRRGRTLDLIGEWLVQNQAGFFARGLPGLRPASRSELAEAIGLHPSTVSRAVAGKAIDVEGRLWPLSVFFSSALAGPEGAVSSRAVRGRIAQIIAAEPPERPHSDESVARLLRAEGVDIARRTVAKYRQGLRIPPTSVRRRLAADRRGD